jgi:hypothetical protein
MSSARLLLLLCMLQLLSVDRYVTITPIEVLYSITSSNPRFYMSLSPLRSSLDQTANYDKCCEQATDS